jgi:hypothetical protein
MCYQSRLVYGLCNHSASLGLVTSWLGLEIRCPDGEDCDGARIHPLKTLRVELMCPSCTEKKSKCDSSFAEVRDRLKKLREELARRGFEAKETDGKHEKNTEQEEVPTENNLGLGNSQEPSSPTADTPAKEQLTKRNDMFVGGVCLSSTTLETVSGNRLL